MDSTRPRQSSATAFLHDPHGRPQHSAATACAVLACSHGPAGGFAQARRCPSLGTKNCQGDRRHLSHLPSVGSRPTPRSITKTELATAFNEVVQWDILFHRRLMISHMMDECIRWAAGSILPSKEAIALTEAITRDWLTPRPASSLRTGELD